MKVIVIGNVRVILKTFKNQIYVYLCHGNRSKTSNRQRGLTRMERMREGRGREGCGRSMLIKLSHILSTVDSKYNPVKAKELQTLPLSLPPSSPHPC